MAGESRLSLTDNICSIPGCFNDREPGKQSAPALCRSGLSPQLSPLQNRQPQRKPKNSQSITNQVLIGPKLSHMKYTVIPGSATRPRNDELNLGANQESD
jgi:hypothetical protein